VVGHDAVVVDHVMTARRTHPERVPVGEDVLPGGASWNEGAPSDGTTIRVDPKRDEEHVGDLGQGGERLAPRDGPAAVDPGRRHVRMAHVGTGLREVRHGDRAGTEQPEKAADVLLELPVARRAGVGQEPTSDQAEAEVHRARQRDRSVAAGQPGHPHAEVAHGREAHATELHRNGRGEESRGLHRVEELDGEPAVLVVGRSGRGGVRGVLVSQRGEPRTGMGHGLQPQVEHAPIRVVLRHLPPADRALSSRSTTRRLVEGDRLADQIPERVLVDRFALVDVDRPPDVAVEARVEQT
jgi:hypothetical protein